MNIFQINNFWTGLFIIINYSIIWPLTIIWTMTNIPTAIFQMAIWNDYISNGHIQTAIFQTAMSFISIYTSSFTLFYKEPITSLLLPHLKMRRLYRLDSSSLSDDDDESDLTLGALHQAHTRYLAMHSSQWGALYLAGNIFIAIEKLDIGGCTMTIFQKL